MNMHLPVLDPKAGGFCMKLDESRIDDAVLALLPDIEVRLWPEVGDPADIHYLLTGSFDPAEVPPLLDAGFSPVSLGPRILRSETAAMATVALAQALWGDLG